MKESIEARIIAITQTGTIISKQKKYNFVAVKLVEKKQLESCSQDWKQLKAKVDFLSKQLPTHPNLLPILGTEETEAFLCLELPLMDCDLFSWLQLKKRKEETKVEICRQLLEAVEALHETSIVHHDLKLENILISERIEEGNEKISVRVNDFFLSEKYEVLENKIFREGNLKGSHGYLLPQMLNKEAFSPYQVDIWSFAVVCFILLEERHPFLQ